MNYFLEDQGNDILDSLFGGIPEADYVLDTWIISGIDYQSAIYWRYFDKVLKQMAQAHDYETFIGIDNGLMMCVNEPISEAIKVLGSGLVVDDEEG